MKICSRCKVEKSLDEFNKQTTRSKDGHQAECRHCKFERRCLRKGIDPSAVETKIRGVNHNYSRTPLYRKWKGMKRRCDSPAAHNYAWYGAKGITYDSSWVSWEGFRSWAMTSGYEPGLELDRIDASKNYCPDNCRWLVKRENIKNARMALSSEVNALLQVEAEKLSITVETLIVQIVSNHFTADTSAITDGWGVS